jgi:hypothetical protein
MVRCPLCRYELDRYDLRGMAFRCDPAQLRSAHVHCLSLRALLYGEEAAAAMEEDVPPMQRVGRLVLRCKDTDVTDGLVYNVCLLAIERALFLRVHMVDRLRGDLEDQHRRHQQPGCFPFDEYRYIQNSLQVHVEVLLHIPPV